MGGFRRAVVGDDRVKNFNETDECVSSFSEEGGSLLTPEDRRAQDGVKKPSRRLLPIFLACAFLIVAVGVRSYDIGGMSNSIIIVAVTVAVLCGVVAFDLRR